MRQLFAHNTPARLQSTAGTWGEIQIVSTAENIVLDIHARNYDTAGHLHRDHALANLPLMTAIRLNALLSEAIEAALDCEPRQAGLWSDSTMRAGAGRRPS
jgi:hypothetical protein